MSDKKNVGMMLKRECRGIQEVAAKSLTSKNKLRKLLGDLMEQETSSENKDSKKHQPFHKAPP